MKHIKVLEKKSFWDKMKGTRREMTPKRKMNILKEVIEKDEIGKIEEFLKYDPRAERIESPVKMQQRTLKMLQLIEKVRIRAHNMDYGGSKASFNGMIEEAKKNITYLEKLEGPISNPKHPEYRRYPTEVTIGAQGTIRELLTKILKANA